MIFSFQGNIILENPLHIVLIAVPLVPQTILIFAIAYIACRVLKLPYNIAAPAGMIGASNFFELAVALATTVGVLTEVPVMLFLVKIANKTAGFFLKTIANHKIKEDKKDHCFTGSGHFFAISHTTSYIEIKDFYLRSNISHRNHEPPI